MREIEVKKFFFFPDIHFPYHNQKALKSAMNFMEDFKPDVVVQLGDLVDFYALSTYSKDPSRLLTLQQELDLANDFWREVRLRCPDAELYMKEGNHEERLQKTIYSKPELSPIAALDLKCLLGLNKYGVSFYRTHERLCFNNCLLVTHGKYVRGKPGASAMAELETRWISGISGHTHRAAKVIDCKNGKYYTWVESGFLGDRAEGFEFMGDVNPNWRNAVTVGYLWHKNNDKKKAREVKFDLVETDSQGNFIYNGKFYTPNGIKNLT